MKDNLFLKVIKRDGREVDFDSSKITSAIAEAGTAAGEFEKNTAEKLTLKVLSLLQNRNKKGHPRVEEIQDTVEEVLLASLYRKTAKAYIIYREQHARMRSIAARFNADLVESYLTKSDWKVNENSNMGYSLQGLNNYISSEISKSYWLNEIYPSEIRNTHIDGDLHIHDLGSLSVYCVGWDLLDLLKEGFKGAVGKVESKPAKHFRSALGQVVNFFYTLQGEAAGAQAFSNFDTLLAPFIRLDELTYKDVKQSIQEFVFNLNVPTRVGFQTPFTNLTFDLTIPSYLASMPVIIGGEPMEAVYGDFQKEVDILNRAFLEVMSGGDARGRIFTFPIPTYNITENFEWENDIIDILWKVTGKYGFAYFANFINSDMNPEDARSMCCRLRIDNRELRNRGGGLFGANPLTGSIGVVTINMPRLGYLAGGREDFLKKLESLMELAESSLEIKRKMLENFSDADLYPYSNFYLRSVKKRFGEYWKNHFSTIGLVGLNEACLNLLGEDIGTENGKIFADSVLDFMRNKLFLFQQETGHMYNLEATPAESTSYRLARIDKEKYPDIIFANNDKVKNQGAEPFYTNSSNLPVNYTDDIFEVLELQETIQKKYTGGTVVHFFIGEKIDNTGVVKNLVKKVCTNYGIPYFTLTPTFSVCPNCGYLAGEHFTCPACGSEAEVYSRVVGYFRTVKNWNKGKRAEFEIRETFKV
ncbi:MAG: ribonucleoside triphosphate reductase [Spirochaetes bacterium]|nr:ribonucleoside triphosphate reductase [Spirochaetota bacterium]